MTRPAILRSAWARVAVAMFAVGWGANQFASLLLSYREHAGVSAGAADALFGSYAIGLIPALLIGGPLSDRYGRRPLARVAVVVSFVASGVLLAGVDGEAWLYVGRLLAGLASGLIFAPGTAWVKELSTTVGGVDSGARRAAVALSAGFGLGPLVAGVVSQWAPAPLVTPYLVHLIVIIVGGTLVWSAPETVTPHGGSVWARIAVHSAASPRFRSVVAPLAPWVFSAAAISLTVGPALVTAHTGSVRVAFAGLLAGLTLGTGVLVQPVARRLDAADDVRTMAVGLSACVAGCLVEALTAVTAQPLLAVAAGLLLGAGYGFCLVAGLLETQRIAPPDELAALTAVYYALTYIGFAVPIALAGLHAFASYRTLLLGAAAVAVLTLVVVLLNARRTVVTRSASADEAVALRRP
ncbi:MFS transporter [uncultured Jatrophihabitans sp.]|uniref:MFS transporter n=1 Tax=uncultured Jatrophihabitans sp. TaxID=1610747 RepID=UPI0035CA0E00